MPHPKGYLREEKGFYYYHDGSVGYYDKYGRWQWFWEKHVQLQQTQKFDQHQQQLRAQIADRFALTSVWGNLQETAREALADTPSNFAAKHSIPLATQQLALHAAFRDVLTRAPSDYHTFQTASAAYLEALVAEATAKKNDGLVDWAHEVTRMIASGDASKALSEARGPTRALDDAARRRGDSVDPTTTPAGLQQAASALINASHRFHEKQDKLTDDAQPEAAKAALQRRLDAAHIEPAGWDYLRALGGPELEAAVWAASKELPAEAERIARTVRALAARQQMDAAALKELEDARVAITSSIRACVPATKPPTPVATASPSSPATTTTVTTSPRLERLTSTETRIRILRDSRAEVRNAIAIDRPECQYALRTAFRDAVEWPCTYPAKEGSAAAAFKIWRTGRGGLLDDQVMRFMSESEEAPALSVGAGDKPPLVDSQPSQSVEQVHEELRDARAFLLPRIKIASSAQAFEAACAQLTPLLKAVQRPELCRDDVLRKFLDELDAVVRHVRIYYPERTRDCHRWYDAFHAAFSSRQGPTESTNLQTTATNAPPLDQVPESCAVVELRLRSVADNLKYLLRPETITLDNVRCELAPLLRQVQRPLFVLNAELLAFVRVFYPLLTIVPVNLQPAVTELYHGFLDAYNGAIAV